MRERVLGDNDRLDLVSLSGEPPISLFIRGPDPRPRERLFPTHGLQRGPLLGLSDGDLSGEGMGFAVSVLRVDGRTIFPGSAVVSLYAPSEEDSSPVVVQVVYSLDRLQTVHLGGGKAVENRRFRLIREWAATVRRRFRRWRAVLECGGGLFKKFGRADCDWAECEPMGTVTVRLAVHRPDARMDIDVDYSALRPESGVLSCLNELDGRLFDCYEDSSGMTLKADQIGPWELTHADEMSLSSPQTSLRYRLRQVEGANLFVGREVRRPDLAWSGLDYEVPLFREGPGRLQYSVWVERSVCS
jgi:hypothetical protein